MRKWLLNRSIQQLLYIFYVLDRNFSFNSKQFPPVLFLSYVFLSVLSEYWTNLSHLFNRGQTWFERTEMRFLLSALNVKVKKFNQARVRQI